MNEEIGYEYSSGNIFEDLGLPNAELENIKMEEEVNKFKNQEANAKNKARRG